MNHGYDSAGRLMQANTPTAAAQRFEFIVQ